MCAPAQRRKRRREAVNGSALGSRHRHRGATRESLVSTHRNAAATRALSGGLRSRHASAASGRDARHRRPRARDRRRASSSSGHLDRRRATGPDRLRDPRDVERPEGRRRAFGRSFGLAAVALGKFKYVLVALKLTKLAPVLSMVASSLAYSAIFGPAYGCGMVGLIFIHECGHILAMRYFGLPFSPMLFIPFVVAVIQMQKLPATAAQSAVVALAGPVVGGVAAGATAFAGHATGSQLLMALGDWGFMINLFNLLPIGGLDGGRVADALHPALRWVWWAAWVLRRPEPFPNPDLLPSAPLGVPGRRPALRVFAATRRTTG